MQRTRMCIFTASVVRPAARVAGSLRRATALGSAICAAAALAGAQHDALARFPQEPRSWDTPRELAIARDAAGARYVEDELLLTLCPGSDRGAVDAGIQALGGRVIGAVPATRLLRVQLAPGASAPAEIDRYAALTGVERAELDGVGEGGWLQSPDDSFFGNQWHLRNTGQFGGTPGADIQMLNAWGITQGSAAVTLAILDTGIDFGHPEFVLRALPGYDFVNEDPDPTYDHAHGLLVTGIAAANTDNAFSVAGVDRSCALVPVKVLDAFNAGTTADLIQGLDYCAQQGVDVVSMSLINYPPTVALQNALVNARNAGCILVACAGNGGIGDADVSWPGASDQTMSIGTSTKTDSRDPGSGTGTLLDFVAPGSMVVTVSNSHVDTFTFFTGCSAATPAAAAIVSLMKAVQPGLTHDAARQFLQDGAEDQVGPPAEDTPGKDAFFGWGRVNAWRSLASLTPCASPSAYGTGKTTSIGTLPVLSSTGHPRDSFGDFAIRIDGGVPGKPTVLFRGASAVSIPFLGGTLWVGPPLVRESVKTLDGAGSASFAVPIGSAMVGVTRYYQVFFRDPLHPDGSGAGLSDALAVQFCP